MKLTVLGPSDILWIYFLIATVFSIVCTIPFAAIQIWLFVKPALHPNEQKMTINVYTGIVYIIYWQGYAFGYFLFCHSIFAISNEQLVMRCLRRCLQRISIFVS